MDLGDNAAPFIESYRGQNAAKLAEIESNIGCIPIENDDHRFIIVAWV